ncbi:hypothetical protein ACTFIU_006502 [Dictyostelium citrinum]
MNTIKTDRIDSIRKRLGRIDIETGGHIVNVKDLYSHKISITGFKSKVVTNSDSLVYRFIKPFNLRIIKLIYTDNQQHQQQLTMSSLSTTVPLPQVSTTNNPQNRKHKF